MSTKTKATSRTTSRKLTLKKSEAAVRESRVVLFGASTDPEVIASQEKLDITGRKSEIQARPNYDTGVGICGKHLCHCKTVCQKEYEQNTTGAYPGDQGATMGGCY